MTAITGAYAVRIPGVVVRLSLSEPIVFLATLLYGPVPGTLTAAVDAFVMSMRLPVRLRTPHRILFNVGALALTLLPSAFLYFRLAGLDPRNPQYGPLETFVGPLYGFALAVFLINSGLVAVAVSLERGLSAFRVWRTQFLWLSASYLASAAIAAILLVFTRTLDLALAAVLLPLVVVSFLTVRTTLGRLDDTNKHLTEVNTLYLSTIETLAMAIDAKDQVTHGHIRRVQRFAVGLARALGVSDDRQIKAIEAAALLHDMGKLAIPEFILNKPGRLSKREFAVMKTHAALGADILSSIHFPYPVVPIVRHHHENWDGTGYPDGIRGSEIPLGARILSVVDCYDALTSDRPYRPALPPQKALEILSQRRGSMYDPLVVDAFIRDHQALSHAAALQDLPQAIISNQHGDLRPADDPALPTAPAAPVQSLRLLASLPTSEGPPLHIACAQVVAALREIASFDTAVVYLLNEDTSDAEVAYANGTGASAFAGRRIPFAERLSGWVAAHRTAVWNSDANLDLGQAPSDVPLLVGSSLPLATLSETTFGVLSLYGRQNQEITIEQRRALESLLPTISAAIGDASQRPGLVIDCTDGRILGSAVASLDALLAHDWGKSATSRPGLLHIAVSSASIEPTASGCAARAAAELWRLLTPSTSLSRCLITLGDTEALFCPLDGSSESTLLAEIAVAQDLKSLRSVKVAVSPVRSPLELHDLFARRQAVSRDIESAQIAEKIH